MSINIRAAQFSDVDGVFLVRTSVIENHLSREEMRRMGITESVVGDMTKKGHCAWVACDNGEIIGFSMILREKGCLYGLYGLFVLPEYEWRGIGRRLTVLAEQELFRHHEIAWLEIDENSRAAKFYMQLGRGNKANLDGTFIRLEKQRDN
ncbi:GNAT family N-acetyltransferase [Rahnella sp. FRB 231]|uniref:GNAT family N-acetyltransferase n=2 Tax=Rahnella ecdela TaxID=2816250 RepID=A0ABS6LB92_9GAMM|nr:GNAT family N-acetyltransferase [Rahnella ecdela]